LLTRENSSVGEAGDSSQRNRGPLAQKKIRAPSDMTQKTDVSASGWGVTKKTSAGLHRGIKRLNNADPMLIGRHEPVNESVGEVKEVKSPFANMRDCFRGYTEEAMIEVPSQLSRS